MQVSDKDVLVKIMHIHNVSYQGESCEAYILLVNRKYCATFRYKEDLDRYLDWFKSQVTGRIIIEVAYKDT